MWIALALLLSLVLASPASARKAFPSAEGYGADATTGGSGGAVILVTNLNNSGSGSLRACMEGTGTRTCVFRIGGMINITSPINVFEANSNLTVAGQTAPSPGITIGPWSINIAYGAHNVIIRHLRHRQAFGEWAGNPSLPPDQNNDCGGFVLYGPNKTPQEGGGTWHVHHVILDHVSTGYTCDDSLQMSGHVTDSTIQWSLVADPYESGKGDPPNSGSSKGFIFGSNTESVSQVSTGTVHHSAFLQSGTRNPGGGPQGVMDWRYNLIYNWFACTGGMRVGGTDENVPGSLTSNHNFVGNRYVAGPDTNTSGCWLGELRTEGNAKIYAQDNVTPFCGMDSCAQNEFQLGWGNGTTQAPPPVSEATFRSLTPFSAPAVTATARTAIESTLSANVGATVPLRDALDNRVINEMQNRTGNVGRNGAPFPTLSTNTSFPADNDSDGMPNQWETDHSLNPNDSNDRNTVAANGYTNLENYLNQLAGDDIGDPGEPPPGANANPIYLSAGGHSDSPTDSGDCTVPETIGTPRATLAAALACMTVPGKILYIRGGTYAGTINTTVGPILGGTTANTPTKIEGYQSETAIIEMPVGGVNALEVSGISNFSVSKLVIDAKSRTDSNALACLSSNNITLTSVELKNAIFEVGYFNGCTNVTITTSLFHDSTSAAVMSFVGTNSTILINRSEIYGGTLQGIEAHSSSTTNGLTVNRTRIHNVGTAIDIGQGSGALLMNNLIYSNTGGVRVRSGAQGSRLYNNTIAVNSGTGILCDAGAGSTTAIEIKNTISFGNGTELTNNCTATTATNLTTNPLFVDAPTNLQLQDASAGINTGTTLLSVVEDFAGTGRPQGATYDIGAYDRDVAPTSPPPGSASHSTRAALMMF